MSKETAENLGDSNVIDVDFVAKKRVSSEGNGNKTNENAKWYDVTPSNDEERKKIVAIRSNIAESKTRDNGNVIPLREKAEMYKLCQQIGTYTDILNENLEKMMSRVHSVENMPLGSRFREQIVPAWLQKTMGYESFLPSKQETRELKRQVETLVGMLDEFIKTQDISDSQQKRKDAQSLYDNLVNLTKITGGFLYVQWYEDTMRIVNNIGIFVRKSL